MDESMRAARSTTGPEQQVSPPLRSSPFGLDSSWSGPRWLESLDGVSPSVVWLGHASQGGQQGVLVGTIWRDAFSREFFIGETDRFTAAALAAGGRFLNVVGPPMPTDPPTIHELVRRHVADAARDVESWRGATWRVSGADVQVRVLPFAGAWIALTNKVSGLYLTAVGVGVPPHGLDLVEVHGADYGVDFTAPIPLSALQRRAPGAVMPLANPAVPHPDQSALL